MGCVLLLLFVVVLLPLALIAGLTSKDKEDSSPRVKTNLSTFYDDPFSKYIFKSGKKPPWAP
jgi:hypothetical protein